MKCKFCDGSGKDYWCLNGEPYPCPVCDGTGEYEPFDTDVELDKLDSEPITNEEWLHTLNTEQLAELITDIRDNDIYANNGFLEPLIMKLVGVREKKLRKSIVVEWLKQPHTPKE